MARYKEQGKVKTEWSPNFAYAIGLITSDGWLSSDRRHIGLVSKDVEVIKNIQSALSLTNRITRAGRGGEIVKKYFKIVFGDKAFYRFLNKIGLTAAKSKTIRAVETPNKFFSDFLRGLFDGDGSFYSFWDKRWPNSFCFKLSFASASSDFIGWLKNKLAELYDVKGYFHKGVGVTNLEYTKGDSKKLFSAMYYSDDVLLLRRKYLKMKTAIRKDRKLGLEYLQKQRAGLA